MKLFFIICWTLVSGFTFGQIAIIYDKEGNCNVRSSAKFGDNIIDKLDNGHFIYCFENSGNWTSINYTKNRKELDGYVYKDRYILVSSYQKIPILAKENSKVILKKDNIEVMLTEQRFDRSKHTLTFYKEYKDQVEFIDNKKFWGTDGGIPATEYKSIEITIGQRKLILPKYAFDDLYEVSLNNTMVNYDKIRDILYIQSMNSDGAGNYEVIWKIEKGIYKERYVAQGF